MITAYQKRIVFLFSLVIAFVPLASTQAVQAQITPANTIILFDIDDVLVLIPTTKKAKFGLYLLVRPDTWKYMVRVKHDAGYVQKMIKEKKKPGFVKRFQHIKKSKKPVEGMVELLRELKGKGYTLHIVSNMVRADFDFYANQYSGIFSLFDEVFVREDDGMPKKPSKRYFDGYRATYPTTKDHFFIDDKEENCEASNFAYTHVFKNASQLRLDFKARGIL